MAMMAAAAFAAAQTPVDLSMSTLTRPAAVVRPAVYIGRALLMEAQQAQSTEDLHGTTVTKSGPLLDTRTTTVQPTHIQSYAPGEPICAGCSPSSAAAVATDPAMQPLPLRCAQAYQYASRAIDDVYGLIPGVPPNEQLEDSMALDDAAGLVLRDPTATEALCTAEKMDELGQLAAALDAELPNLKSDSDAHQRADVENRAAGAVRDMKRWLP
jgi:hypothetical protein